jgi:hypothetical protein
VGAHIASVLMPMARKRVVASLFDEFM